MTTNKLSFIEKAGYALGDAGANLVFQTLMYFQVVYFSKTLGLSAAAVSWIFLIGRLFDAVTDPVMGVLADRTKTKWGRFRPWLLWSAIPFALILWLTFSVPGGFEQHYKLIYVWILYTALMAIYTVNNVPYCALNGVMSSDVNERTSISAYRFVAVMITTFFVSGFTLTFVDKFGNGNDMRGWSMTIGLYALISIGLFVIAFFSVRERVVPDPEQDTSVKQDIFDAFNNRPWAVLFVSTLAIFMMLSIRGGSLSLFTEFYVDHGALGEFLSGLGLVQAEGANLTGLQAIFDKIGYIVKPDGSNVDSVGFGLMNMAGNTVTVIGVILSKPLSEKFGKRTVFCTSLALTAAATLWLFFIKPDSIGMMFLQSLAWAACYSPSIPLLWSMIGDAADFGEWKYHRRATGFVFAGVVFALKAGLGLGGFIGAQVLGFYGFAEGNETSVDSLLGIRMTVAVLPAIALAIAAASFIFYPISKQLLGQISDELEERRKHFKTETEGAPSA